MRRALTIIIALASVTLGTTSLALAQGYPNRRAHHHVDGGRWLARHHGAHNRSKSLGLDGPAVLR